VIQINRTIAHWIPLIKTNLTSYSTSLETSSMMRYHMLNINYQNRKNKYSTHNISSWQMFLNMYY